MKDLDWTAVAAIGMVILSVGAFIFGFFAPKFGIYPGADCQREIQGQVVQDYC